MVSLGWFQIKEHIYRISIVASIDNHRMMMIIMRKRGLNPFIFYESLHLKKSKWAITFFKKNIIKKGYRRIQYVFTRINLDFIKETDRRIRNLKDIYLNSFYLLNS